MKKTIIYNSPSGEITIYNFKEPLMPLPKPLFGYQGVLIYDKNIKKVQCSICGKWFKQITYKHLKSHRITTIEYRKLIGLKYDQSLSSEGTLEKKYKNAVMNNQIERCKENATKYRKVNRAKHLEKMVKDHGQCNKEI